MEIRIPLDLYSANSYKELKSSLRQLELSVHHAQKAVESAEDMGVEVTENLFINFDHPFLRTSTKIDSAKEPMTSTDGITDNYYEELQNVELVINLN